MPESLESQLPLPPSSPPTISLSLQPQDTEEQNYDSSSLLPPLPTHDGDDDDLNEDSTHDYADEYARDDSHLAGPAHDDHDASLNRTMNEEREMHRKLMDMESSFLPEPSTLQVGGTTTGVDDTYLVGVDAPGTPRKAEGKENKGRSLFTSPEPPLDEYKTPAPLRAADLEPSLIEDGRQTLEGDSLVGVNTSSLETISSPPTAAAAARTISRVLSAASSRSGKYGESMGPEERGQEHTYQDETSYTEQDGDLETTPRKSRSQLRIQSPPPSRSLQDGDTVDSDANQTSGMQGTTDSIINQQRTRPKFLVSRQSSHRLSTSSITTANTDGALSDATMGMDYALQSGGALPSNNDRAPQSHGRPKMDLSRSISLGSMASGVSNLSDDHPYERRVFSGVSELSLHTLDEEESASQRPVSPGTTVKQGDDVAPTTPKSKAIDPSSPPGTVLTQIQNLPAPSTVRKYQESLGPSPDKRSGSRTPGFGRGKNMTLKEQSSTIDRLSKENFDLKMRIHFLNQALNKRSEDGIKEMISENVELKSDKIKAQKDNQALRRIIRELERQLKEKADPADENKDEQTSEAGKRTIDEEEFLYLRERIETYEVEIERLRAENITRESEKRKLAEMVKALGDGRSGISDSGAREERDMWKDILDAETAAREQSEEENKRLRGQILQLENDISFHQCRDPRHRKGNSTLSHVSSDYEGSRGFGQSSLTRELELLKQENTELRREVSAQTSMLTSRNREKEKLYQEIEDLKIERRNEGRSIAGDSIFERSASRAQSRAMSQASDNDRDNLENKNGELRDQVSALKLDNQGLRSQLDEYANELGAMEREYQAELDRLGEDLRDIQVQRDRALQAIEAREADLQDLKAEAQEELDAMGEELDIKHEDCHRLELEVRSQQENLDALQAEVRSANEGISRLEEDAQSNLLKYKAVQQELDYVNQEIEAMERSLSEANNKIQRLTVQQESSQNEIAFLREEQDGDKIKIGDLESELRFTQTSFQSEKEKSNELDRQLADERYQREVVGSKEKQEVQRIIDDLNRESTASKEEIRKLKKNLSSREVEASMWKDRLMELESSLREALGDLNGTRSSLLMSITKLQKELETTSLELESIRTKLDEKEALLRNRDGLLESHGLETQKLADLLERERQARRADKHSFEQSLKSHHQASRTIVQNNSRITDLEGARNQDRKRFNNLEQQYRDQLNERNVMFLTLWKRLSTMCGPDWSHSNSLINGNLPSQEVIGNMLFWPGFSKNLLLAVKTVENSINGFKSRVRTVERNLMKEYQGLENNLSLRVKKLDRLEDMVRQMQNNRRPTITSTSTNAELSKLKGENRLLKAELNLLQSHSRVKIANDGSARGQPSKMSNSRSVGSSLARFSAGSEQGPAPANTRSGRSNSSLSRGSSNIPQPSPFSSSTTLANNPGSSDVAPNNTTSSSVSGHQPSSNSEASQDRWIQRLRDLERRLKAEREARLLDRSGARERLAERNAENEKLRAALERERMNRATSSMGGDGACDNPDRNPRTPERSRRHENQSHERESRNRETDDSRSSGADVVVIDHGYEPDSRGHSEGPSTRSGSYDGEGDDDEDDGTGTDEDGGLCVEVVV
ncbi:anucleate primary sterigmata protein B [Arthroderma uncinatum]|uniref:anucleate primary sterigmata protein B n=1 Tax=Arthroderma uncinatum TaxID=74035 RepID=UPI00144A7B2D|nr:anucleate primary sterigmata protein B [Arthroderma uncinatum]KAF3479886.1 anucleate primary sterigmata protein B [Arthroderma uncinatum]